MSNSLLKELLAFLIFNFFFSVLNLNLKPAFSEGFEEKETNFVFILALLEKEFRRYSSASQFKKRTPFFPIKMGCYTGGLTRRPISFSVSEIQIPETKTQREKTFLADIYKGTDIPAENTVRPFP